MILSTRMKIAEKDIEMIEGKSVVDLARENEKLASENGWIANMQIITRLLGFKYYWDGNWKRFVKELYNWQKNMYKTYFEIRSDFFKDEWGIVGKNTLFLLNYLYNSIMRDREEKTDVNKTQMGEKPTRVNKNITVLPQVILYNDQSGNFLVKVKSVLQKILPSGSMIVSGYRSPGMQKGALDKYFDLATDHPSFSQFKNKFLTMKDKQKIAEKYMQNVEGREGWRIALPGISNHQRGIAMDIVGANISDVVRALQELKLHPIDGIGIETRMGDKEGILPEGSHVHAVFRRV